MVHDHVVGPNTTVIVSQSGAEGQEKSFDLIFFGVFKVWGSIFLACINQMIVPFKFVGSITTNKPFIYGTFYVKTPPVGPVELFKVVGDLSGPGLTHNFNFALISGTVAFKVRDASSGLDRELFIKFRQEIKTGDLKFLTLPYYSHL